MPTNSVFLARHALGFVIAVALGCLASHTSAFAQQNSRESLLQAVEKALAAAHAAEKAASLAVPSGTVVFIDAARCPAGWTRFSPLNGRLVLAAGSASGVTARKYKQKGGSERITLPKHVHETALGISPAQAKSVGVETGASTATIYGSQMAGGALRAKTTPAGDNPKDSNFPPFYVLTACRRN